MEEIREKTIRIQFFFPKICHGLLETLGINLSSLGSGHVGAKLHRIKTDFHSIYCRIPGV